MSYQQRLQQDDAPAAFADELDAGDVTSQGETTSVETPEGRPDHPDIELPRGNRGRDFNLRHNIHIKQIQRGGYAAHSKEKKCHRKFTGGTLVTIPIIVMDVCQSCSGPG